MDVNVLAVFAMGWMVHRAELAWREAATLKVEAAHVTSSSQSTARSDRHNGMNQFPRSWPATTQWYGRSDAWASIARAERSRMRAMTIKLPSIPQAVGRSRRLSERCTAISGVRLLLLVA